MKHINIEIKWAFIFTAATLLWAILEKTLGFYDEKIAMHMFFGLLFAPVGIYIYILALKEKRKISLNGSATWKELFISGLILTIGVALLTPFTQWIHHTHLAPEFFPNMIAMTVGNGRMTPENAAIYFNLNSYIMQSVIFAISVGVVSSAIVAYFLRSKEVIKS
jgi:membrane-associated HD superfamily phosphohydrolase